MSDHEPCMLYSDCVSVEDFIPMCRECDDKPAAKVVMLDALNNGMTVAFGQEMCDDCATEVADRLRESLPSPPPEENTEPDMSRMGEKHIKPCRGCDALILWAKHFKTDGTVGKVAPLVKAKEGEKANICAWYEEKEDQWYYGIGAGCQPGPVEYVNHFSNCARSKDFRAASLSEEEALQSEIK